MKDVNTAMDDKKQKSGRQALWMVAALSAFYAIMMIRMASHSGQLLPLLPGLLHFVLFGLGFCVLAVASRSGSYKPELIGAIILAIAIAMTLGDCLFGESLRRNIVYLVVRGLFLSALIRSVRARKVRTKEEEGPLPTPWYTWVSVPLLAAALLMPTVGALWSRSQKDETPNNSVDPISEPARDAHGSREGSQ